MPGDYLDISSEPDPKLTDAVTDARRSFVGICFACCGVYTRIYVNRHETAYEGYCPKCGRPARIRVGPGGTDARFFTAY